MYSFSKLSSVVGAKFPCPTDGQSDDKKKKIFGRQLIFSPNEIFLV